ncbi:MAG TPA: histidine phosphatase family protein [Conexibacter sp.]|jgi:probable phosphoglycerate mutase
MARDFQRPFTVPEGACEVLLVRHGSAPSTLQPGDALIDGHNDPPLSPDGHRQAEAVGQRLASELADGRSLRGFYVTPLQRTAQTAAPLAGLIAREPEVVDDLREVHLGVWEGRLNHRIESDPIAREVFTTQRWDVIPGAEPMDGFSARVRRGIDHVTAGGGDGTVVAVVHGGVIAEACRQATGSDAFAFLYAENGSITRLVRGASGRWTLRGFNDVSHLSGIFGAGTAADVADDADSEHARA